MPNDDYIKRSDALNTIHSVPPGNWSRARYMDAVERVPAADVEPVRHGRWIDENPASPMDPRMRCSVCGEVSIPYAKWCFCPMCGAKIDKEEEHE